MKVELDAFSGRPNPQWRLTESEGAALARLIADLEPAATGSPSDPPGLGYRGFRLEGATGEIRVYQGFVRSPGRVLADGNRRVEGFLLDHLPEALNDLRPWLEAEIRPKRG